MQTPSIEVNQGHSINLLNYYLSVAWADRTEIGIPRTGPNLRGKGAISEWPQPPFYK